MNQLRPTFFPSPPIKLGLCAVPVLWVEACERRRIVLLFSRESGLISFLINLAAPEVPKMYGSGRLTGGALTARSDGSLCVSEADDACLLFVSRIGTQKEKVSWPDVDSFWTTCAGSGSSSHNSPDASDVGPTPLEE